MLTQAQIDRYNKFAPAEGLAQLVSQKRGCVKAVWDFAVHGGAQGTVNLVDDNGDTVELPDNAIITQVYLDVLEAPASAGGDGTIAFGANTTTDLKGATDGDTLTGIVAGTPVGTAATMVKLTAARKLTATIGTEALTKGKIAAFVEFVLSA